MERATVEHETVDTKTKAERSVHLGERGERAIDALKTQRAHTELAGHKGVRRDGEWPNFSYSYQLGVGARKLSMTAVGKRVDGFAECCRLLRATPDLAPARELVTQAERVLLAGFDQMQNKAQLMAQTTYREALKAAADLWQQCVNEWGRSRGYRQAVAAFSRAWFTDEKRETMEDELRATLDREWRRTLDSVAELLEPEPAAKVPMSPIPRSS